MPDIIEENTPLDITEKSPDKQTPVVLRPFSLGLTFFLFSLLLWSAENKSSSMEILAWISIVLSAVCMIIIIIKRIKVYAEKHIRSTPIKIVLSISYMAYMLSFFVGWLGYLDDIHSDKYRFYIGFIGGGLWLLLILLVIFSSVGQWFRLIGSIIFILYAGLQFYDSEYLTGGLSIATAFIIVIVPRRLSEYVDELFN